MTRHRTLRRALLPTLIASAFAGPRQADEYLLPQLNASGKMTHNHQEETQQTEIPSSRGTGSPFSSGLGDDTYHSAGWRWRRSRPAFPIRVPWTPLLRDFPS